MSDAPHIDTALRLVSTALEEYADWYGQIVRRIFYPEASNALSPVVAPKSFVAMNDLTKSPKLMAQGDLDRIVKLQKELQAASDKLMTTAAAGNRPGFEHFNELNNMFDELLQRLRRIEFDQFMAGRGHDAASGLRTADVMFRDLEREMERVARRGRSFSISLGRLDDGDKLRAELGDQFNLLLRWLGDAILLTIRTFDDAYRLDNDEFVMALKHADLQGAQRFVSRLREQMTTNPLIVNGKTIDVVMSFCVAEPVAGEEMPKFLDLMRKDLNNKPADAAGDLVTYEEVSPLQRFLSEVEGS